MKQVKDDPEPDTIWKGPGLNKTPKILPYILGFILAWIGITSMIQGIKNDHLTQSQLFKKIPESVILDFDDEDKIITIRTYGDWIKTDSATWKFKETSREIIDDEQEVTIPAIHYVTSDSVVFAINIIGTKSPTIQYSRDGINWRQYVKNDTTTKQ